MKNPWILGLISFLGCVILGTTLSWPSAEKAGHADFPPVEPPPPVVSELKPVVPAWRLPQDLPTITPEETRSGWTTTAEDPLLASASPETYAQGGGNLDPWDLAWDDQATDSWAGQFRAEIDPSNYGDRYAKDIHGKPAQNEILVVLHESASSAESAIHTFKNHHPRDEDQVSYHALILLDGRIVHLVDPAKRAYGAGNSEFAGSNGIEAVQTNKNVASSVNNFAYHISLETPLDGQDNPSEIHSGYTLSQYDSLAWLVSQLQVKRDRITTHREVDRNQERGDPRSFDMDYFQALLSSYS